jgi:hypothetical protein
VVPAPAKDRPKMTIGEATMKIWASPTLQSRHEIALGYGEVTISKNQTGVPRVSHLLAWIGFAESSNLAFCPAQTATSPTLSKSSASGLPTSGFAAVIIGATNGSPAVTYVARSEICDSIAPAALAKATEIVSVPWIQTGRSNIALSIRTLLPPCGSLDGISSGGSGKMFSVSVTASVPDVLNNCAPAHYVSQEIDFGPPNNPPGAPPPIVTASTLITHGKVGPLPLTMAH